MAVIIRLTLIQNNKAACFNTKIHCEEIHETFNDQNTTDSSLMTRRLQHFSDDKIIPLEPYYPHGIK